MVKLPRVRGLTPFRPRPSPSCRQPAPRDHRSVREFDTIEARLRGPLYYAKSRAHLPVLVRSGTGSPSSASGRERSALSRPDAGSFTIWARPRNASSTSAEPLHPGRGGGHVDLEGSGRRPYGYGRTLARARGRRQPGAHPIARVLGAAPRGGTERTPHSRSGPVLHPGLEGSRDVPPDYAAEMVPFSGSRWEAILKDTAPSPSGPLLGGWPNNGSYTIRNLSTARVEPRVSS